MTITGADIEKLRELATNFQDNWANELQDLRESIDARVTDSVNIWVGPDANNFRDEVWPEHRAHIDSAKEALIAAAATANANANAQEDTSANLV